MNPALKQEISVFCEPEHLKNMQLLDKVHTGFTAALQNRSNIYSVPPNIRTGPTDVNAFRGHRLTTQKGYTLSYTLNNFRLKQIQDVSNSTTVCGKERRILIGPW